MMMNCGECLELESRLLSCPVAAMASRPWLRHIRTSLSAHRHIRKRTRKKITTVLVVVVVVAVVAAVFIQLLICRLEEGDSSFDWSMMMTRDEAGEVRAKVRFIEWIKIDI